MASQGVRLRPYTFFARLPRGVTNVELVKLLVQRFTKNELSGVQDFSAGRFEVVFKTKDAVDRFLADPVVEVRGEQVRFEYRGSRVKIVRVFNYPLEEQDEELRRVLGEYGSVHGMQRETIPGFADFVSGTRRVRMDMVRPVPNLVKVLDRYVARFEYEGVVRQCVRCGGTGHYAAACTTPKCSRCEQFGHESCEALCPQCQGDHARYQCRVRSFAAAVAGRTAAAVPESVGDETEKRAAAEPVNEEASTSDHVANERVEHATPQANASVEGASNEAQKSEEHAAPAVDALEQTTPPAQPPAEAAAVAAPEAAPSLAAAANSLAAESALMTPLSGASSAAKKKNRRKGKRKLFEARKEGSTTGLRKASDSEVEPEAASPVQRKRVAAPGAEQSEVEDAEFSSLSSSDEETDMDEVK